jgi:hypothetical protein
MKDYEWAVSVNAGAMLTFIFQKNSKRLNAKPIARRFRLFACALVRLMDWELLLKYGRNLQEAACMSEKYVDWTEPESFICSASAAAMKASRDIENGRGRLAAEHVYLTCTAESSYVAKQALQWFPGICSDAIKADVIRDLFLPFGHPLDMLCDGCGGHGITIDANEKKHVCKPCKGKGKVRSNAAEWLKWHDGIILKTAERAYQEGKYDETPVLADMLEDAGAVNVDIWLAHLRKREPCTGCTAGPIDVSQYGGGGGRCNRCRTIGGSASWMPLRQRCVRGCWALDLCRGVGVMRDY